MEAINVRPTTPGDYSIRNGEAEKVKHPLALNINGILAVPAEFLTGKKEEYAQELAHLSIDKDNQTLKLVLDEYDPNSKDEIICKLLDDAEVVLWGINSSTRWPVGALLQFVRERRFFFEDRSEQERLLASLQK